LSSPHLEGSPATTFRACSSPAPTPVKPQPAPAILSQESVHTTLSITHHTRKRPSTSPRTTHGPQNFSFTWCNFGYHEAFSWAFIFHKGILAIKELFTWIFFFLRWNSGYQGAFSRISLSHNGILAIKEHFHEFLFHTMEFWLSRILLMSFYFSRRNSSYQRAFHTNFFLFHDGILAIKEPFHKFLFHTMEF
jgi:hypothetical protein